MVPLETKIQLRSEATTYFTLKQYTKHFLYLVLMLSFFLCVCIPVEWSVFVLRVLSELSLVLLVQESDGTEDNEKAEEKKERGDEGGKAAEGVDDGSSCSQMLALILKTLLPRLVWLFLSILLSLVSTFDFLFL